MYWCSVEYVMVFCRVCAGFLWSMYWCPKEYSMYWFIYWWSIQYVLVFCRVCTGVLKSMYWFMYWWSVEYVLVCVLVFCRVCTGVLYSMYWYSVEYVLVFCTQYSPSCCHSLCLTAEDSWPGGNVNNSRAHTAHRFSAHTLTHTHTHSHTLTLAALWSRRIEPPVLLTHISQI